MCDEAGVSNGRAGDEHINGDFRGRAVRIVNRECRNSNQQLITTLDESFFIRGCEAYFTNL